ncbi:hypothetical protein QBC33DRAFT_440084, partial [Phialemonium atrogriseum]
KRIYITTSSSIVYPNLIGKATVPIVSPDSQKVEMVLNYAIHVFTFPINIFSSKQLYQARSYLQHNKVVASDSKILTKLDIPKQGFFMTVYRQPKPL